MGVAALVQLVTALGATLDMATWLEVVAVFDTSAQATAPALSDLAATLAEQHQGQVWTLCISPSVLCSASRCTWQWLSPPGSAARAHGPRASSDESRHLCANPAVCPKGNSMATANVSGGTLPKLCAAAGADLGKCVWPRRRRRQLQALMCRALQLRPDMEALTGSCPLLGSAWCARPLPAMQHDVHRNKPCVGSSHHQ